MNPMHSFFDFPFSLQPNPGRANYRCACQHPYGIIAFKSVHLVADKKLALCRNVIVSMRVGQSLVLESPTSFFNDGAFKLVSPVTVLLHQDIFISLLWEVGDDWYRLNQRNDPLCGKVVLPFWTVQRNRMLRAERPRTGLADVPAYQPGRVVYCQGNEDGDV